MSKAMEKALEIARRDGAVLAGTSVCNGAVERVSASAIAALVRRGLLVGFVSPDGGVAGRLLETK